MITFKRTGPMANREVHATAPNGDLYRIVTIRTFGKVPTYEVFLHGTMVHQTGSLSQAQGWVTATVKATNRF